MKQFGYTIENSITPNDVARTMADLVTDGKWTGGTMLECSTEGTRALGVWNVDPPAGVGTAVPQEFIDINYAPIHALLKSERGGVSKI